MTPPLSDTLEATARALADSDLDTLSGVLDVAAVIDAFEHAAAIAAEVEHEADRAANLARTATAPAYPPLVALLGRAVTEVTR